MVQNIYDDGSRYLARAYPGETQPATTVYVPYAVRNWFTSASWRQTTDLVIQNTGTQPANVSVTFYDSWGAYGGSNTVNATNFPALGNVPPLGQVVVPGTAMSIWEAGSNNSLSSAVVQSTQPVAVVAVTLTGVPDITGAIATAYLAGDYRAFTSAANSVFLPVAAREYYTYNSSPQVQNASASNTTVRIRFYANGASTPALDTTQVIGPYQSFNLWHPAGLPDNFLGSALLTVNAGGPIAAMAQYDRFDAAHALYGVMQYEGVTIATQTNVLAHVQKTSPWTYTGIQAQNMGGSSTSVTESYYNSSGGSAGTSVAKTAPSSSAVNFWTAGTEIPSTLDGSAVSGSNPYVPLAVVTNFDQLGNTAWTNRDGLLGYSAVK